MVGSSQPVGDGDISEEKVRLLLSLGGELDDLDFKAQLDLTTTRDKVELVKDFGAFQSQPSGGYILVGVDDSGTPVQGHGLLDAKQFDPAKLSQIAHAYLPTIQVAATTYDIDGALVAVIYVGPPNPPGVAIFVKDGQYADGAKQKTTFRAGDVFVRRGTQSVRWHPGDLGWVLKPWEDRIREDERHRAAEYAQTLLAGNRARELADGPVGSLSWRLASDDFDRALLEAMRSRDRITLRSLALTMNADGQSLLREEAGDELRLLVDRTTAALALCITYDDEAIFNEFLGVMVSLYMGGTDGNGNAKPSGDAFYAKHLWSIAVAAEALGGLAVRLEALWAVRPLTLPSEKLSRSISEPTWIRHALTQAARANLLLTESQREPGRDIPIGGPVVAVARQLVERVPALRPDTSVEPFELNAAPASSDPVLDSLVQFDVYWCVIAVAHGRDGNHYPSFAVFYAFRSVPAFERLILDSTTRELFLNGDSDKLKPAMLAVAQDAQSIAMNDYRRPWSLNESRAVMDFFA